MIHPTAIVHPQAKLHPTIRVGPYAVIDAEVELGADCVVGPHVYLTGRTSIGRGNKFHAGCVIGDAPQDLKYKDEPTNLRIVKAHKGVCRWLVTTTGRSCHSSTPELGVNAVYRMAHVLAGIERYAAELRASRSDPLLGPPTQMGVFRRCG